MGNIKNLTDRQMDDYIESFKAMLTVSNYIKSREDKYKEIIKLIGNDKQLIRDVINTYTTEIRVDKLNKIKNKIYGN